jgi:hypothetical protein
MANWRNKKREIKSLKNNIANAAGRFDEEIRENVNGIWRKKKCLFMFIFPRIATIYYNIYTILYDRIRDQP